MYKVFTKKTIFLLFVNNDWITFNYRTLAMIRGTSKSGRTTSRVSSCRASWWLVHRRQAPPHSILSSPSIQTSPPTCPTLRPSRRYSSSTGATTTEACLGEFPCHICVFCFVNKRVEQTFRRKKANRKMRWPDEKIHAMLDEKFSLFFKTLQKSISLAYF